MLNVSQHRSLECPYRNLWQFITIELKAESAEWRRTESLNLFTFSHHHSYRLATHYINRDPYRNIFYVYEIDGTKQIFYTDGVFYFLFLAPFNLLNVLYKSIIFEAHQCYFQLIKFPPSNLSSNYLDHFWHVLFNNSQHSSSYP